MAVALGDQCYQTTGVTVKAAARCRCLSSLNCGTLVLGLLGGLGSLGWTSKRKLLGSLLGSLHLDQLFHLAAGRTQR